MGGKKRKPKALVLLSGGLDSMLAAKIISGQGVEVEAVNFVTPFSTSNEQSVKKLGEELGIRVHRVFLGQDFLDIVADPRHGYGSKMNPCIDCRIHTFRKAKELAERIGADFLVTGEVLGERPFSQRKEAMLLIEREAGLEGKILRPLSAKLMPESEPEKKGWVDREKLLAIKGRRRLQQIELARKLGMRDYPTPSGGCLLTDPQFATRLREHLEHEGKLTMDDVALLRLGRHFRVNSAKVIVGRNKEENEKLLEIAKSLKVPYLQVTSYEGPITIHKGEERPRSMKRAAAITVRYSDAHEEASVRVTYSGGKEEVMEARAAKDEELQNLRI
jgi:tRNA-specific 2-thiouridylase